MQDRKPEGKGILVTNWKTCVCTIMLQLGPFYSGF